MEMLIKTGYDKLTVSIATTLITTTITTITTTITVIYWNPV